MERSVSDIERGLEHCGIEVLVNDRDERPGVKFKDADLIGVPLCVTVGERGLKNGTVELKRRTEKEARSLPLDGVIEAIAADVRAFHALESRAIA